MIAMMLLLLAGAEAPLPDCVDRLAAEPAACDQVIASEKDGAVRARLLVRRAYGLNEKYRTEEAIRDLTEALKLDPSNPVAWHERSYSWSELREFARAAADSDREVALRPDDPGAYSERAHARRGLGDFQGAWADRDKIVALKPKTADTLLDRADAVLWLGRFDAAARDIDAALALAKGDDELTARAERLKEDLRLWTARGASGAPDKACRDAEKAGTFDRPGLIGDCSAAFLAAAKPGDKAEFLTVRADAWIAQKQNQPAYIGDMEAAVAVDPSNPDWHANLGGGYTFVHHSRAGLRELDIALAMKESWTALANRAGARYNLDDRAGALKDAKRSFELHPNDSALMTLGSLAHDRGDDASAKRYWLAAWKLGARGDDLRAQLRSIGVEDPDKAAASD